MHGKTHEGQPERTFYIVNCNKINIFKNKDLLLSGGGGIPGISDRGLAYHTKYSDRSVLLQYFLISF